MGRPEFFLYLPQMRMPVDAVCERASAAERSGFTGIAFMDHLAPPLAEDTPMYEAMTLATWVAARTTDLVVSHLVLCDAFRHPTVLAKQAVTLDHASGGRFELALGWGSIAHELESYGVTDDGAPERVARLSESLTIVRALWAGGPVVHHGAHFDVDCAGQQPTPLGSIPVVVGGTGPRTLGLVREHADWWNVPIYGLDRLEELRPAARTGRRRSPWPTGGSAACRAARSPGTPTSWWRRSHRSTSGGSTGSTCGSPTSPHRPRSRPSGTRSSG
jgi:alkanesulfonate monooxygenase SsuD/methylene tetrahydromethanopterin reductase-like flavin-dependent oxidoreductase (luciferase family)